MDAAQLQRVLVLLASVCAAAAAPAASEAAESELAVSAAAGFEPGLMEETSAALASQHSQLMADTDVFGLYRDDPDPAPAVPRGSVGPAGPAPALVVGGGRFPGLLAAFSGPVLPAVGPGDGPVLPVVGPGDGPVLPVVGPGDGPVLQLTPVRWGGVVPAEGVREEAEREEHPTQQASADDAGSQESPRQTAYAAAPKTQLVRSRSRQLPEPEQPTARSEASPTESETKPAGPQETVAAPETVAPPDLRTPPASPAQPLTLPDTHIFCLLPEPGRRRRTKPPVRSRIEPAGRESAAEEAARPETPGAASAPGGSSGAATPEQSDSKPNKPAAKRGSEDSQDPGLGTPERDPALFPGEPEQPVGLSGQQAADAEAAAFDRLWNQFGAVGPPVVFEPYPDQPASSEPGADPEALPDPSTFGQLPSSAQPTEDADSQGAQELIGNPTFFAPYPRRPQYPQRSRSYYPSRSPSSASRWGRPAGSPWPYAGRPAPTSVSRRTAYPAPWRGHGSGPVGAIGWPWPALAAESRGRPRAVPYLVQRAGRYPLYSQWYRPAVVPLPGGGRGTGGWWTPEGRFVRPAVAMATSEESAADSPSLSADWPWPAVSLLGGRDALVVTGLGRSSGAMARAGGQHGWPPVAIATAGGSRSGGSFSRASSGGFELIFEDGMFHTGPMALKKSPDEYVPPPKRPKNPTKATEDAGAKDGQTETTSSADGQTETVAADGGEDDRAEETVEGSGAEGQ